MGGLSVLGEQFNHICFHLERFCNISWYLVFLKWTPSGRRLITGSQSGEFTLWNGQSFNFEMILQVWMCR